MLDRAATICASMSKKLTESARLATAYHEAGHAVIAWKSGIKVKSVTIVPGDGFDGQVDQASPLRGINLEFDGSDRARIRAEAAIVISLAEPLAQRRFSPRSWHSYHGATDHAVVTELAMRVSGSQEQMQAFVYWLRLVARDMVALLWPIIEKVAAALIERNTLSAEEFLDVITRREDVTVTPRDSGVLAMHAASTR
jgi:hypothetical protein